MLLKDKVTVYTYNVTADDVVLTKLLSKVCKLTVSWFLSCSSVSKGKGFLAWKKMQFKKKQKTAHVSFMLNILLIVWLLSPSWVLQWLRDHPILTTWGSGSLPGRCFTGISSLIWRASGQIGSKTSERAREKTAREDLVQHNSNKALHQVIKQWLEGNPAQFSKIRLRWVVAMSDY